MTEAEIEQARTESRQRIAQWRAAIHVHEWKGHGVEYTPERRREINKYWTRIEQEMRAQNERLPL